MTETQVCRRCGTENRPGVSFCESCGQRLVAAEDATLARPTTTAEGGPCPRCGATNRSGSAFCSECGFNIRPAVAAAGASLPVSPPATLPSAPVVAARPARAWLGPLVLVVGAVGMATAWVLPFAVGAGSLAEQALGPDGYGLAFWTAYPDDAGLLEAAYFGLAAPLPVLVGVMLLLAAVGVVRAVPGRGQRVGLGIVLAWCAAFAILFVVFEIGSALGDDLIGLLRSLSPAGLIGFLSGVIGSIGSVTRLAGG
ncbi:MAG TPA: zinc ribbon domain-containing protein [Candidatus Limnocylindria bacterium]|nr:zinc ribbon domain-containing protein [Candidatus Limnocylindria bacterium]